MNALAKNGPDYSGQRQRMVRSQIESRGLSDSRILDVLREIPRHRFVDEALSHSAYGDHALPIGHEQTISQPYMVALMTHKLAPTPNCRILEIGTGSGYQTAVLGKLCRSVFTIERIPPLALRAQNLLPKLGIENVSYRIGDGTLGWPRFAPFDGILVAAGAPDVPPTLIEQLAEGGRLVIPTGERGRQGLQLFTKGPGDDGEWAESVSCSFVPLIGREGWEE